MIRLRKVTLNQTSDWRRHWSCDGARDQQRRGPPVGGRCRRCFGPGRAIPRRADRLSTTPAAPRLCTSTINVYISIHQNPTLPHSFFYFTKSSSRPIPKRLALLLHPIQLTSFNHFILFNYLIQFNSIDFITWFNSIEFTSFNHLIQFNSIDFIKSFHLFHFTL